MDIFNAKKIDSTYKVQILASNRSYVFDCDFFLTEQQSFLSAAWNCSIPLIPLKCVKILNKTTNSSFKRSFRVVSSKQKKLKKKHLPFKWEFKQDYIEH